MAWHQGLWPDCPWITPSLCWNPHINYTHLTDMDRWTQPCTHWQVFFHGMAPLYSKVWLHRSLWYVSVTLTLVVQWHCVHRIWWKPQRQNTCWCFLCVKGAYVLTLHNGSRLTTDWVSDTCKFTQQQPSCLVSNLNEVCGALTLPKICIGECRSRGCWLALYVLEAENQGFHGSL